ncbi:universal stress protein [Salinigranum halophilum]|jgi:nucleotide-binding universal stress UspA family protein|uniref:universal stress protein n=1 Tax=Salinigranum halophilum TaxID=2565931 RepID=UPI00115DC932|nr:universal stress protein [Salinigranum halophilum]
MYEVVVLATDGSTPARDACDQAIALARAEAATLHVLSVVDEGDLDLFSSGELPTVDDLLRGAAEDAVDDAAERAGDTGVDAVRAVRVGTPHREIADYADEVGADLVVVGTHGRRGLSRALLGSVAARLLRQSPVPVLVVPQSPP